MNAVSMNPTFSSSYVKAIGYDHENKALHIKYVGAKIFVYKDVPEDVYKALSNSPSKGTYVHTHIKNKYEYEELS